MKEKLTRMTVQQLMEMPDLEERLEEFTPYTASRSRMVTAQLLKQWLDEEDTWEQFPITKKEMFKKHKNFFGELPEVTLPTLYVFNNLIESGVLA